MQEQARWFIECWLKDPVQDTLTFKNQIVVKLANPGYYNFETTDVTKFFESYIDLTLYREVRVTAREYEPEVLTVL